MFKSQTWQSAEKHILMSQHNKIQMLNFIPGNEQLFFFSFIGVEYSCLKQLEASHLMLSHVMCVQQEVHRVSIS